MERYTYRTSGGTVLLVDDIDGRYTANEVIDMLAERLAAYEDTGISPEELTGLLRSPVYIAACVLNGAAISHERAIEIAKAEVEGRLTIIPPPAKEGDPKPSCFYNDNGGIWCTGMAPEDGDEPTERCKQCWYCEYGYAALAEDTNVPTKTATDTTVGSKEG